MFPTLRRTILGLALLSLAGCAHQQLSEGSVRDVQRLAVVVRAAPGPMVAVATKNAAENRAYPTLTPAEGDQRLQEALTKQVTVFEVEERLRATLMGKLPETPPWSTALPAAEVATVLQSLLIVDRTVPIDYKALQGAGADAVMELQVLEWGVKHHQGKTGLYLKGDGRLFRLPGKSGIWASSLDTDLTKDPESDSADVVALRNGGFREALIGLIDKLATRLAGELSGRH